jgi:hypothetical protein
VTERKEYERTYKSVVPIPIRGDDEVRAKDGELARWLGRERFEIVVAGDRLEVVEYADRQIPIEEVDPRLGEMLGKPVEAFDWYEFRGVGRLNRAVFDWFAAEFVWNCEQWLEAERAYLVSIDAEHQADNGGA